MMGSLKSTPVSSTKTHQTTFGDLTTILAATAAFRTAPRREGAVRGLARLPARVEAYGRRDPGVLVIPGDHESGRGLANDVPSVIGPCARADHSPRRRAS